MKAALAWLLERPWVALVVALIVEAAVVVASQGDFAASDPLWYAGIANEIATDPAAAFATPDHHPFHMRVGLTLPLALIYKLFGVSLLTTNLPCILAALAIMLVVYAAAPTPRAKLVGLVIVLACTPLVRHASMLNVDLPSAALMAISTLFLAWREKPRGSMWVIAAMVAWVFAFLVKESALWSFVVWIYVIVADLRRLGARATAARFVPGIAVGLALGIVYLVICARVWGNPLARFAGIQELTDGHVWSMTNRTTGEWVARLVWMTPVALAKMFMATLVPVVLSPWLVRRREDRIWLVACGSSIALFWFGTTSFSAYAPLPMSTRMMLPMLPGILVVSALASDGAIERLAASRWRLPVIGVFAAAIVVPGLFSARFFVTRPRPETTAYAVVRAAVEDPAKNVILVCGDPRCASISEFHFRFAPPPNMQIVFAGHWAAGPQPTGSTVFALVNLRRGASSEWVDPAADPLKYRVEKITNLNLPVLVRSGTVRLFDAADGVPLWEALRSNRP